METTSLYATLKSLNSEGTTAISNGRHSMMLTENNGVVYGEYLPPHSLAAIHRSKSSYAMPPAIGVMPGDNNYDNLANFQPTSHQTHSSASLLLHQKQQQGKQTMPPSSLLGEGPSFTTVALPRLALSAHLPNTNPFLNIASPSSCFGISLRAHVVMSPHPSMTSRITPNHGLVGPAPLPVVLVFIDGTIGKQPMLHRGDQVVAVNGISVLNAPSLDFVEHLIEQSSSVLNVTVSSTVAENKTAASTSSFDSSLRKSDEENLSSNASSSDPLEDGIVTLRRRHCVVPPAARPQLTKFAESNNQKNAATRLFSSTNHLSQSNGRPLTICGYQSLNSSCKVPDQNNHYAEMSSGRSSDSRAASKLTAFVPPTVSTSRAQVSISSCSTSSRTSVSSSGQVSTMVQVAPQTLVQNPSALKPLQQVQPEKPVDNLRIYLSIPPSSSQIPEQKAPIARVESYSSQTLKFPPDSSQSLGDSGVYSSGIYDSQIEGSSGCLGRKTSLPTNSLYQQCQVSTQPALPDRAALDSSALSSSVPAATGEVIYGQAISQSAYHHSQVKVATTSTGNSNLSAVNRRVSFLKATTAPVSSTTIKEDELSDHQLPRAHVEPQLLTSVRQPQGAIDLTGNYFKLPPAAKPRPPHFVQFVETPFMFVKCFINSF